MKKLFAVVLCSFLMSTIAENSVATALFTVEAAPTFSSDGGATYTVGTYGTVWSSEFTFGTPTNAGTIGTTVSAENNDFWIKSQTGLYDAGPPVVNQMVIQLEPDTGLYFDLAAKTNEVTGAIAGGDYWSQMIKFSVEGIAFDSEPFLYSISTIQSTIMNPGFDPTTEIWPQIQFVDVDAVPGYPANDLTMDTTWDGSLFGLSYTFNGALWNAHMLEGGAVRMIAIYDGPLVNIGDTNGGGTGEVPEVPEPATILLFATGLAGLAGSRLRRKNK